MPTPDLDRARAALAAGDAVAAEAALRGAPPSAQALALRAGVEAMRAEPAAEASARAALAIDPGCGLAHRHLAVALIQRGDPAAALRHAERGAALEPDDPGAHEVVAVAAAGAGRFGAAWDAFVRVAALRPDDATPWRNAGQVALAVDEHAAAAHAFTQALARAPTLAPALEGQARALAALGRDADAAAAWARLAALDPSRADARHLATALAGGHADAPPPATRARCSTPTPRASTSCWSIASSTAGRRWCAPRSPIAPRSRARSISAAAPAWSAPRCATAART